MGSSQDSDSAHYVPNGTNGVKRESPPGHLHDAMQGTVQHRR